MNNRLSHHAEPVPPTGAIAAHGIRSALGRPTLDRWTLFLRETVQNAWDARNIGSKEPVRYTAELRNPTREQHHSLVQQVLGERADGMRDFWPRLAKPDQWWLVVHDRGTVGLRGPERAGVPAEQNNFADFVWNFGIPKKDEHTGGTYGCGRTVFFTTSAPSASDPGGSVALIHSRYRANDRLRSRFIAMGLGDNYAKGGHLYTGRHWWGRKPEPGLPTAPLEEPAADVLAQSLGLPAFRPKETGTTVLVPCCDLRAEEDGQAMVEEKAALDVMNRLIEAAAWHCWPKIVDLGPGPEMALSFVLNGRELPGPDPDRHPEIRHFVTCLKACLGERRSGVEAAPIRSQKPKRHLGYLALNRFPEEPRPPAEVPPRPFEGAVRHTALMRAPKLIVKYLPGPESPSEGTAWAGVFLADDASDAEFADAEPPPHDDWIVRPGKKYQRNLVRIALRQVEEQVQRFNSEASPQLEQPTEPLGRLADALGDLLSGGPSGGPGKEPQPHIPGPRRLLAKIEQGEARLENDERTRLLIVPFQVLPKHGTRHTLVEAFVNVAINDGSSSEREAPDGIPMPGLRGYLSPAGELRRSPKVEVLATDRGTWETVVELPEDVAVRVRFKAHPPEIEP